MLILPNLDNAVTHEQIYLRLIEVEAKVDAIDANTKQLVEAFEALQGALKVLNWIASLAKPIAIITAVGTFFALIWNNVTTHK
jgi:hypothetical protein